MSEGEEGERGSSTHVQEIIVCLMREAKERRRLQTDKRWFQQSTRETGKRVTGTDWIMIRDAPEKRTSPILPDCLPDC